MILKDNFPKIAVVKIGTSSLTDKNGNIDKMSIAKIAGQVKEMADMGCATVLVSSGAIKVGMQKLGIEKRPKILPELQACCAAGQPYLMEVYNDIFDIYGLKTAQILLTAEDFRSRKRFVNMRNTFGVLLEMGCVPIVKENDTVSIDEIKFGENDTLSALVATGVNADLLINLSDVNGLYTSDPSKDENAKRIPVVEKITDDIINMGGSSVSGVGSGGMATKIKAAVIATNSGVRFVIANAKEENIILRCAKGEDVGTKFLGGENKYSGKKSWIAFAAKTKGTINVDRTAKEMLVSGKSLLSVGIESAEGLFENGDIVRVACENKVFAKGITYYSSKDLEKIAGAKTSEIESILGSKPYEEIIHHNNMVIL
ncbi:MAG: glutamate 5-kinase [Armatimonadetes bacterium]|nr:glutamate 5-kinase [Candidatus Hippobium faecium]